MYENPHDPDYCECPAGVMHRVENNIQALVIAIVCFGGFALLSAFVMVLKRIGRAVARIDWTGVGMMVGVTVLAVVAAFVVFLMIHAVWYDWKTEKKVPKALTGVKKLVMWTYRGLIRFFARRDYRKLIKDRPEVAKISWSEMVLSQSEHPERERVTNPAVLRELEAVFVRERERAGYGVQVEIDVERINMN